MKLLPRRVEWQFQRNLQQHAFADELRIKVERVKKCFTENNLPFPTAEVIAAWKDLPNVTIDIIPTSMKTGMEVLRAPPPTPTGLTFDTDNINPSDDSPLNHSLDGGWSLVDTDTSMPGMVAFQDLEPSPASEACPISSRSYPDQESKEQINEDLFRTIASSSPSSDHESLSSSGQSSSTPVGFQNMVDQWLLDYSTRGLEPFVESLIAFGAVSIGTASLASRIGRAVSRKVAKMSYMEGKNLETTTRLAALTTFRNYWGSDDSLVEVSCVRGDTLTPTPYGLNIASFVGSLFDAGIFNAKDVHLCLSLLTGGEKHFDRLCAMHALLVQAGDKLCKSRNLPALMQFKEEITLRDTETGEFVWGATPHSKAIIADTIAMIERWLVSQALKRDQIGTSLGNRRNINQRAIGPRLCNNTVPVS